MYPPWMKKIMSTSLARQGRRTSGRNGQRAEPIWSLSCTGSGLPTSSGQGGGPCSWITKTCKLRRKESRGGDCYGGAESAETLAISVVWGG